MIKVKDRLQAVRSLEQFVKNNNLSYVLADKTIGLGANCSRNYIQQKSLPQGKQMAALQAFFALSSEEQKAKIPVKPPVEKTYTTLTHRVQILESELKLLCTEFRNYKDMNERAGYPKARTSWNPLKTTTN